jgi:hypothetical protein
VQATVDSLVGELHEEFGGDGAPDGR